ncbi:MAG: zinc-binding dehydrogenase [Alphaproteobacteria bacterium]|nr:zinc-binding dehydrogenase [Alphaproteobacteria bacterium]
MKVTAALSHGPGKPFTLEDVDLDDPRPDEVLVRLVATGICHTDLYVRDLIPATAVLGHEGAGVVEAVGADVTKVQPSDHVVLSYAWCGACPSCESGEPYYCHDFNVRNMGGARPDGTPTLRRRGAPLFGNFFGQSSFATFALATEANVVKVRKDAPLEVLGPLGCGVQTGAGAVMNGLEPLPGEAFVVFGAGTVGLSAVMAANLIGCEPLIVVDPLPARRDLAKRLGAHHAIDPAAADPVKQILTITGHGALYSLECTGIPAVFEQAVRCLGPRGTCGFLGAPPPGATAAIDLGGLLSKGLRIRGMIEGESVVDAFIPHLLDLFLDGLLPFDTLVTFYDLDRINEAVADSLEGRTVKPVLRMPR